MKNRKKQEVMPLELRKMRNKVRLESREERAAAKAARESTLPPEAQVPGLRRWYSYCHYRTEDMVRDCEKPAQWLGLLSGITPYFTSYCDRCKSREDVGRAVRRWWRSSEEVPAPLKRERINSVEVKHVEQKRVRLLTNIKTVLAREDEE